LSWGHQAWLERGRDHRNKGYGIVNEPDIQAKIRVVLCAMYDNPIQVFDQRHFQVLDPDELKVLFRIVGKTAVASFKFRLVQKGADTDEGKS
jgi:hypothetical protein